MAETLMNLDVYCFQAVYGVRGPRVMTLAMIVLTISGSAWRDVVIAPLLAFRRTRHVGLALALVLIVAELATTLLKHVIGRLRPPFVLPNVHALWGPTSSPSFPSGHTTASFAMASFLAAVLSRGRRPRSTMGDLGGLALLTWAAGVAVSRVYLGVHFPSDVIGSALIGTAIGAGAGRAFCLVNFARTTPRSRSAPAATSCIDSESPHRTRKS